MCVAFFHCSKTQPWEVERVIPCVVLNLCGMVSALWLLCSKLGKYWRYSASSLLLNLPWFRAGFKLKLSMDWWAPKKRRGPVWSECTKFSLQEGQLSVPSSFKSTWNRFVSICIDQIWWEFCPLSLIDDFPKETEIGGQAAITDAGIHTLEKWFYSCFTTIDHCILQGINESLFLKWKEKTQSQIPRFCRFFLPFGGSKSLCHS